MSELALIHAAAHGHISIIHHLLKQPKLNVNFADGFALCCAVFRGDFQMAQLLLQHGADVRSLNDRALKYATKNRRFEIITLLLQHGADIHTGNDYVLKCAAQNHDLQLVAHLLDHGAAFNTEWKYIPPHIRRFCSDYSFSSLGSKSAIKCS